MSKRDKDPAPVPEFSDRSTTELWSFYKGANEVDPYTGVDRPEERRKRVRKQRKGLEGILNKEAPDQGSLIDVHGSAEAKDKAARIVQQLVHKGYQADESGAKAPDVNQIRRYLTEALGPNVTYEDVLKELISARDLGDLDSLPQNSSVRALVDYVSNQHDVEGRQMNDVQRELIQNYEHHDVLKGIISDAIGTQLRASASPQEALQEYQSHLAAKSAELESKRAKAHKEGPHYMPDSQKAADRARFGDHRESQKAADRSKFGKKDSPQQYDRTGTDG